MLPSSRCSPAKALCGLTLGEPLSVMLALTWRREMVLDVSKPALTEHPK